MIWLGPRSYWRPATRRTRGRCLLRVSVTFNDVYVNRVTQERTLEDLVRGIPEPVDIVLTEGFKREAAPKIEVSREERSTSLIAEPEELIALVADHDGPRQDVPRLEMDDYAGIVNVLVDFVYGLGSD